MYRTPAEMSHVRMFTAFAAWPPPRLLSVCRSGDGESGDGESGDGESGDGEAGDGGLEMASLEMPSLEIFSWAFSFEP